jgi:hypothetical protein
MDDITWETLVAALPDAKCTKMVESLEGDVSAVVAEAKTTFRLNGMTLVTGAGVSRTAGVPDWSALLSRLRNVSLPTTLSHSGKQTIGAVVTQLSHSDSPLIAARNVAVSMQESELLSHVREILYSESESSSDLLDELARVCVKNPPSIGIIGILTYNYDDLLEARLEVQGIQSTSLFRDAKVGTGHLPVRHVHGYLPQKEHSHEGIVLTESQYHAEYGRPYSWSNVVQINTFRETSCLFVGSSLSDPNQRRLLELARAENPHTHFAILRRTRVDDVVGGLSLGWATRGKGMGKPSGKQNKQVRDRCALVARLLDDSRARGLLQLGVKTIWVDEHAESIARLKELRVDV